MRFGKLIFLILMSVMTTLEVYSATLTGTTLYVNSGTGTVNTVGDKVNGNDICAAVNTYANATPGCDMSTDVGYNNNGTGDNSDDYYDGDLIVRTNDIFTVGAKYSFNGATPGVDDTVTLTGTLPAGTGFIWDHLPTGAGNCAMPGSSISADGKTIVCVRENLGASFSQIFNLPVRVEGDAPNGSTPGDIVVTYEAPNTTTVVDGVEDGNPANLIKVTAAPRWNLQKYYYATYKGKQDDLGNDGWYLYYKYYIEVDEVSGEVDSFDQPYLGNEALAGGSDATVTFTDDLSQISPNTKLVTWEPADIIFEANNACDMDSLSGGNDPYPALDTTYPERSIPVPAGTMAVSCVQTGQSVAVTIDHIDGTLTHAPTQTGSGVALPVKKRIAAIGIMRVFVPYSDVFSQPGQELATHNSMSGFDPDSISGTSNFGPLTESELDNFYNLPLKAGGGAYSKEYRRGWSDQLDQAAEWGGTAWYAPPTNASAVYSGDGGAGAGTMFGTYTIYINTGVVDQTNVELCDVIDINTFTMEKLRTTDDPATFLDDSKHAIDIQYSNTYKLTDLNVSYAIGYVGAWPPNPYEAPGAAVGNECNDSSVVWYPDYVSAKAAADAAGTDVSKVKLSVPLLASGETMNMRIKHKARATHRDDSPMIPGELLVNYAAYKSPYSNDVYSNSLYRPRDETQVPGSGAAGDRLIFGRAKARILKHMYPTGLGLGDESNVTLSPSFTFGGSEAGLSVDGTLVIVDLLPEGLGYKAGSTVGNYGGTPYGEPLVIPNPTDADCNTYASTLLAQNAPCGTLNGGTGKETLLVWDLGTVTTGTVMSDLNLTSYVKVDAPAGTLKNYAQIESDMDKSNPLLRGANFNVTVSVPSALLIKKEVLTPLHEINSGGLLNWMEFRVGARNGGGTNLIDLDMIDMIPFNGDGVASSISFTPLGGTTIQTQRTPATSYTGDFAFDSVTFDDNGMCDATNVEFWFTKEPQASLDLGPNASTNTKADGTPESIWCQGTTAGPDAGCGFTNAEVTAVRSRKVAINSGSTCFLNVKFATNNNTDGDIYANSAAGNAKTTSGTLLDGVMTNVVTAQVYASSIGDFVWQDDNANGIQDGAEAGVDGITVKLYDAANQLLGTTVTAGGGLYTFSNLTQGNYIVEIEPGANLLTTEMAGVDITADSDFNTTTNRTDIIALGENEDKTTIDAGLIPLNLNISGHVFDDGDGDANVNGVAISAPSGTQLYATLVDDANSAVATKAIAADGSYLFSTADGVRPDSNYTIVLSTTASGTTASLPTDWNNTGENINSLGAGKDGTVDGIIAVEVASVDITDIDFGINHAPTADDKTEPAQQNPGGTNTAVVPTLSGADDESATLVYTITTLPANATLYYNGTVITAPNFVVADPSLLTVDPNNGAQTVVFNYTTTDEVGVVSSPATVTMPFTPLMISGHVFDDGDGDANVNGTGIATPSGTQLHATLLDAGGTAVATTPIAADGSYSFSTGVFSNTNYSVVLATTANATASDLPANWNNTGENINSTGAGNDGTVDGVIVVSVPTDNVTQVDFGINHRPVADDKTEPAQANPGGIAQVSVPTLTGADDESATLVYTITTLPANAALYYNGTIITAPNFVVADPSLLTVDPDNGTQTVVFNYTTTDEVGVVSSPATVTMPFTGIEISGHVFDDGDGDANVNGTGIATPSGTQLHATLLDAGGTVVATTPIAADGSYSFDDADGVALNTNFTVVLATTPNATASDLPAAWNNTGENINSAGAGNDGTIDGQLAVAVGATAGVTQVDFGINHAPTADDKTEPAQQNPGGTNTAVVPTLSGADDESATLVYTITTLPANATLYYNGTVITAPNFVVADPSLLTVDPNNGAQTVVFNYTTTDEVGVVSSPATVTMPFTPLMISGHVFDDGDGDANVNGTGIATPSGTQLHATLLDAGGTAVATTPIAADGSYSFSTGVFSNTNYSVVLATTANATASDLPANWNNTGENINSTGAGNDGTVDGVIVVSVPTDNVTQVDFGINHRPVAHDTSEAPQLNPGGTTTAVVPDLNVTDTEDGTPTTITIKSLPGNATLYYNGLPASVDQVIVGYNPALLTVDPIDGDQTVEFDYTTTDRVGIESEPVTVSMPFLGLGISGTLYDDGNGDGNVNGTAIGDASGTPLYVSLVDTAGNVIASHVVASDGSYLFTGAEGVTAHTSYTVILGTVQGPIGSVAPTPDLPTNWNNTGENINSAGTGNDGTVDGSISVAVGTVGVTLVDFGINHAPTAEDRTDPARSNPAGDTKYPVPALPVADTEDGTPTTITIIDLPDPTTGVLYYNGIPVVPGQVITGYDPSLLEVDPTEGNPTMVFTYTTTDAAGITSAPATITMPFLGDMFIGDRVWLDTNGNGAQDAGEPGVAGEVVKLYSEDGTLVATTETNSSGEYLIKVTEPGNYYIEFNNSRYFTVDCPPCEDANDSDVAASNPRTATFALDYGQTDLTHDAGIAPVAHIGDYVWNDADGNGIQNDGEEGMKGVTVELLDENGEPVLDADGNPIATTTDANGSYELYAPANHSYVVRFTMTPEQIEEGYVYSAANNADDTSDSDVDENGVIAVPVLAVAGENVLTIDAGINCGCADAQSDSADAMTTLSLWLMMLTMLMGGLLFVRREEA